MCIRDRDVVCAAAHCGLTVPHAIAPALARKLVEHGVRGLWNFTGEDLHLENLGVPVENVHFSDNLMTLCYQVNQSEAQS